MLCLRSTGGSPSITASIAATGTIVQKPWEDFIWGGSPTTGGQWPFGITNRTGQMRFGNVRKSKIARTITTLPATEFLGPPDGGTDLDANTDLLTSFSPKYQKGVTGIVSGCAHPGDFGAPVTPPGNVPILWRGVFQTGTENGPNHVSFKNLAFTSYGGVIQGECTTRIHYENIYITACTRGITHLSNCYYGRLEKFVIAAFTAGSSQSWGIGLFAASGVDIINDVNFGSQCSATAGIAIQGGAFLSSVYMNTVSGQWGLYCQGGDMWMSDCGFGDEGGAGLQDAGAFFAGCNMIDWRGGGVFPISAASGTAAVRIDGGTHYKFDVDMGAAPGSSSALIKFVTPALYRVELPQPYQGQGLDPAIPWTDGSGDIEITPLEKGGRTVWNATGSGSITCQWYTSADHFGVPIAQGASGGPTGPDFSCHTIVITDGPPVLTGTTPLIPPTNASGHTRRIVAPSTHAITWAGNTVAAGHSAVFESNGTSTWDRVSADV